MYNDPFDIDRFHREFDEMLDMFRASRNNSLMRNSRESDKMEMSNSAKRPGLPKVHSHETENKVIVAFELPGVNKEDIEIHVNENRIEIKVESQQQKKEENSVWQNRRSYHRIVSFPTQVDPNQAEAVYENGIVRVELPKKSPGSGRRLEIK